MHITKDTTDDELLASVRLAKVALHMASGKENADNRTSGDYITLVNNLAREEGRVEARYELRNALAHDADIDAVRRHLVSVGLRQPDDTWSGRENDTKRAKNDGRRDEVQSLLTQLNRGDWKHMMGGR